MNKAAAFAFLSLLIAGAAFAQTNPSERLIELERLMEQERGRERGLARETQAAIAAIADLRLKSVDAAQAASAAEDQAYEIETRIAALDEEAATRREAIDKRRAEIAATAGALLQLARRPPESLALEPHSPLESARAGLLASAAIPELERRAGELRRELTALETARVAAAREREKLSKALAALAAESARLDAAIEARNKALARLSADAGDQAAKLARMAREAQDLRDLMARLEDRPAHPAPMPARAPAARTLAPSRATGELAALAGYRWPVRGGVLESYGDTQSGGQTARGLTIEPRETAAVVAPFDGTVAFAGPFRGYGLILILEHSGGYHSVLAQLGRIDAVVGQAVTAGEPVGRAGASEQGTPMLYLELRRNGQPVDPTPLLFGAEAGARR